MGSRACIRRKKKFDKNGLINAIPLSRSFIKHSSFSCDFHVWRCQFHLFLNRIRNARSRSLCFYVYASVVCRNFMLTILFGSQSLSLSFPIFAFYILFSRSSSAFVQLWACCVSFSIMFSSKWTYHLMKARFLSVPNNVRVYVCLLAHAPKPEFNWLETFATHVMAI